MESVNFDLVDYRLSVRVETSVDFDLDYDFRNITTFDILYKRPPCPITQQEVDYMVGALGGNTIQLETTYIEREMKDMGPYKDAFLQLGASVPFVAEICGEL